MAGAPVGHPSLPGQLRKESGISLRDRGPPMTAPERSNGAGGWFLPVPGTRQKSPREGPPSSLTMPDVCA